MTCYCVIEKTPWWIDKFFGMENLATDMVSTQTLVLFYVETLFYTRSNRTVMSNAKKKCSMALERIQQLLHTMNNTILLLFKALTVPWLQQF